MSLPGKTMKIGGWNYHVSDQGTVAIKGSNAGSRHAR